MEADFMARLAQFLFSLLMLLLICSCRQRHQVVEGPWLDKHQVRIKAAKGICYVNDEAFTGTLFERSTAGDTISTASYLNGREHGLWMANHHKSIRKELRYFVDGKKQGEYKVWWENGNLKLQAHFKDDEFDGLMQTWDKDGSILRQANYVAGHEEGTQKVWYVNGKIKSNYVVLKGRRYGLLGTKHCINVSDSVFSNL
jgi:antitoxin component YwqK of YwqJK toxin-antitoxin module